MGRHLGLDPSRNLGWCHGELDGPTFSGVLKLTNKQKSQRDLAMLNFLIDLIKGNGITDIYVEKPIMPKITSFQALATLYGYATVVGLAAAMTGCNAYFIDMQSWRAEIGSPTQAPKQVKGTEARRKWLKQATIDFIAKVYKIVAKTDDEADAIGIWLCAKIRKQTKTNEPGFDFDKDLDI